jgi:hypothetical protein
MNQEKRRARARHKARLGRLSRSGIHSKPSVLRQSRIGESWLSQAVQIAAMLELRGKK